MKARSSGLVVICVALVAGSGGIAYLLTSRPSRAPIAATPIIAKAPDTPAALPPSQHTEASTLSPEAALAAAQVRFPPLVKNFSLIRDSAAYDAATLAGPQLYPLQAGTGLVSASQSPDGAWIIALTADGQAAFIPTADLGPYDPSKAPLPAEISGAAQVADTASLTVDGQHVSLQGITGEAGDYAAQMQTMVDGAGTVSCHLSGTASYVCTLPDGNDIARMALFNGGAKTTDDASRDYRAQEQSARDGHRGIWAQ